MLRRRRRIRLLPLLLIAVMAWGGWLVFGWLQTSFGSREAELARVVDAFYAFEQQGDFGSSWELFHSDMHARFTKESYIETRAHVFLNHFAVRTFSYTLDEPEFVGEWRMDARAGKLSHVYRVKARTVFDSPIFGLFELAQLCYIAQEDGEWRVLWDYRSEMGAE
ncbi:hypothetical protein [Paenibacillus sp. 1P07SE]|uniref:hypothetical protein n=1 Tax=Paenibacillus sp. 1P07SE TaxID=3132209 RepID=UPI0039A560E8